MKGFFKFLIFVGLIFAALMAFSESFREHFYMHLDYMRENCPCCGQDCDFILMEDEMLDNADKEVEKKGEELKEAVEESAKETNKK